MSRTKWKVYTKTGSGNTWEEDGYIYAPNENLDCVINSTISEGQTANGGKYLVQPEVRFNYDMLTFTYIGISKIDADDILFVEKIREYLFAGELIKIVDSDENEMVGVFNSLNEVFILGEEDTKDFQLSFIRIE